MKETAINWDNENANVYISTSETYIKDRLNKLCKQFPNHYMLESSSDDYNNYIVKEKKLIRFVKPILLTEKQKEILRKRLTKNIDK